MNYNFVYRINTERLGEFLGIIDSGSAIIDGRVSSITLNRNFRNWLQDNNIRRPKIEIVSISIGLSLDLVFHSEQDFALFRLGWL